MFLEIEYDEVLYDVEFSFELGSSGSYDEAPYPHEVTIESIVDEEGEEHSIKTLDVEIMDYIEEQVYQYVDENEY